MDSASTGDRCQFCHPIAASLKNGDCAACSGSFVIHKVLVLDDSDDQYLSICPASLFGGTSGSTSCSSTHLPERTVSSAPSVILGQTEMNLSGLRSTPESQKELQGAIMSAVNSALHSSPLADRAANASATEANNRTGATEPEQIEAKVGQEPQGLKKQF